MSRLLTQLLLPTLFLLPVPLLNAQDKQDPKKPQPPKMIAGKAELLAHIPKKFAAFLGVEKDGTHVRLHIEGDKEPSVWPLKSDVEVKIHGWWGRAEQLPKGDRTWVWFDVDRVKKPRSILMLADEPSEQDIHDKEYTVTALDTRTHDITCKYLRGKEHVLKADSLPPWVLPGSKMLIQQRAGKVRDFLTLDQFAAERKKQQERRAAEWLKDGIPGTVTFLHPLGGEMDYMLDHEGIRWGRWLKPGDEVVLRAAPPVKGVVKDVKPWRERTLLRLVTGGFDQADLTLGQRVAALLPRPPAEIEKSELPPDIDRVRPKHERIDWVMASTYCGCRVLGDRCTGMFYTLASCNVNACGMPNHVRAIVAEMIEAGKTDRQIVEQMMKEQGRVILRPHLLH